MANKPRFKYDRSRTVESINRRAKQSSGSYDSYIDSALPSFKPREGENQIRILPWREADAPEDLIKKWGDSWNVDIWIHYGVGPDEAAYLCNNKINGGPCPICEASFNASDADEKKQFRPTWRALCWVINRDDERAGPQVWSMPATLYREINLRSQDKKTGKPLLIDDPENGYDVIFNREGQDVRTKYTAVEVDRDPTPLSESDKLYNRWLDFIMDNMLPDRLNFYDADYIEKVLYGEAGSRRRGRDDEEEEEDRRSRGRRSDRNEGDAPRSRRRAAREEDVEEEEEEEEAPRGRRARSRDAEEEDERPSRRRASRSRDEEEEEEEEEAPRGRRARGKVDEEEEEEDENPPGKASSRGSTKRYRPSGDTEEEEEEEEEAEEDAPRRSRRRASRDEEEDEDGDPSEDRGSRSARERLEEMRERRSRK